MEKKVFISRNIRAYLFAHHLRHEDLAEKLGISAQAIGKWIKENRCPPPPTLAQLALHIQVQPDELAFQDLTFSIIGAATIQPLVKQAETDDSALRLMVREHLLSIQRQLLSIADQNQRCLDNI